MRQLPELAEDILTSRKHRRNAQFSPTLPINLLFAGIILDEGHITMMSKVELQAEATLHEQRLIHIAPDPGASPTIQDSETTSFMSGAQSHFFDLVNHELISWHTDTTYTTIPMNLSVPQVS